MAKLEFLRSVLADEGFYCVVGLDKKKKDGGKGRKPVQKFFNNLEDAIRVAEELSENEYNTYYALSTFRDGSSREAENAQYIKALFLDIDYGEIHGKPSVYATYEEAVNALKKFCRAVGLPTPAIVSSGGGIHTYWPLSNKVSPHEWYPVAVRLRELCADHAFAADPVVTSDCARILRVPDTYNYRAEEPRDVVIKQYANAAHPLDHFIDILGTSDKTFLSTMKRSADEMTESLGGENYPDCSFKRILIRTIQGDGCEQLRNVYENQASIDEPVWVAGLSITKFCIEASASLKISSMYHGFSEEEMEDKLSRLSAPMSCDKFNERNHGVCGNCPHWGKIKTPIILGKIVQEAPPKTLDEIQSEYVEAEEPETESNEEVENDERKSPLIPFPYFRGANGGIYKRVNTGEGTKEVMVLATDLFVIRRQDDMEKGTCAVIQRYLPKDGVREFTVPLSIVSTNDEFRKTLNYFGLPVMDTKEVAAYVMKVVQELQKSCKSGIAYRRFGWTDESYTEFVLGRNILKLNKGSGAVEVIPNAPTSVTDKYFPVFSPHGSREKCIDILGFFNQPGMYAHQFQIGAAFGAPLMRMTDIYAALAHFFSPESGVGKSTSMRASAGIWGNPKEIVGKATDTTNAKLHKSQVFGDLPNYVDEMTNVSAKEASDYILSMTDGQQKDRMKSSSNETRERAEPWHTLIVTNGNLPLTEKLFGYKKYYAAEELRVFEDRVMPLAGLSKESTDILSKDIQSNYGHLGPEYVAFLIQYSEDIKLRFLATRTEIDKALAFDKQHRFYSAMIAAVMTGLQIAKKMGLVDYDLKGLMDWIRLKVRQKLEQQAIAHSFDAMGYINQFTAEFIGDMLRIHSCDDGRDVSGVDHLAQADAIPRGKFKMRYEYDIKRLFILQPPLKLWCAENGVGFGVLVNALETEGKGKIVRKYMGKGLRIDWGTQNVLMVDWSGSDAEDETEESSAA